MEECLRKLALWHTKTFKPIMSHDEMEPIMATLGFVFLPLRQSPATSTGGAILTWQEYAFTAGGWQKESPTEALPRPRLPYPKIDGLHIYTYRAFLDAVNFYLEMSDISDLFHIRGMPMYRIHDRNRKFRRMEEDDNVFVYREGTLEQATYMFYNNNKHNNSSSSNHNNYKSIGIRSKSNTNQTSCIVPLKDVIV